MSDKCLVEIEAKLKIAIDALEWIADKCPKKEKFDGRISAITLIGNMAREALEKIK